MKFFFTLLITLGLNCSYGQTMADFYSNNTQVVLLGLDFTQCKFIGKKLFNNPEGIKNYAIKQWNRFFATEPAKYSLQEAFGLKDKYYYNSINYFLNRNDQLVNTFQNITDEEYHLTKEDIIENVKTYEPFEKEGLAVSFVVESFNHLTNEATIWVTFLNVETKEVIYTEKMVGSPGGAGQVNFWARGVYDIVNQIEKRKEELRAIR